MNFHEAMWAEASRDVQAEQTERMTAMASIALAESMPFLVAAQSEAEYDQRLALAMPTLQTRLAAVTDDPRIHEAALAQARADWLTLNQGRTAARLAEALQTEAGTQDSAGNYRVSHPEHGKGWTKSAPWTKGKAAVDWDNGAVDMDNGVDVSDLNYKTSAKTEAGRWSDPKTTCRVCNERIEQHNGGWRHAEYASGAGRGHQRRSHDAIPAKGAAKTASISLSNVGIVDRAGLVCKGTDPSGKEVQFKVTQAEMNQLASVLYGDLAMNLSGVSIEEGDIIKGAAKVAYDNANYGDSSGATGQKCTACNGNGEVDGKECPTCGGTGTLSHDGSKKESAAVVPPFGGEAVTASADGFDFTDEDILEAEAMLAEGFGGLKNKIKDLVRLEPTQEEMDARWQKNWDRSMEYEHSALDRAQKEREKKAPTSHVAPAVGSRKQATVACRKCASGYTPDGAACGYCDGAGALDATMAMIKAADGWDQGITAQSFLVQAQDTPAEGDSDGQILNAIQRRDPDGRSDEPTQADYDAFEAWVVDSWGQKWLDRYRGQWGHQPGDEPRHVESVREDGKGSARYQDTQGRAKPAWIADEWDEGKADQATLDTGRAGYTPPEKRAAKEAASREEGGPSDYGWPGSNSGIDRSPRNGDEPKVHTFNSTGEAYDHSQFDDDIEDGDVLHVPSEGVTGFLQAAWPIALHHNGDPGAFHGAQGDPQDVFGGGPTGKQYGLKDYSSTLAKAKEVHQGGKTASTNKVADLAALIRRLERLSGQNVDLQYTSDWGVDRTAGRLTFADGNATVTTSTGAVHSIPAHNVLMVEGTDGFEGDVAGDSAPDREPGVLDWLGTGLGNNTLVPSIGARREANSYTSNGYAAEGPGNPGATVTPPSAADTAPQTTRPRVAPSGNDVPGFDPEQYPSTEVSPTRTGPVDRNADSLVLGPDSAEEQKAQERAQQVSAATRAFTAPPVKTARQAKVEQIASAVLASNPGMNRQAALRVAEDTLARYSGVASS